MRIKYKILFLMALLIIFVSALFTFFSYRIVNENLLNSIDQKLLSAAHNAKVVVNSNYHDNITDANSVANNRYREITEKYSSLCYGLEIHSLISLLLINDKLVYTSSMISDSEHGEDFFFKEHPHPEIFADSLNEMEIEFSSRPKPWGIERMVIIPDIDKKGRKYLFAVCTNLDELIYARAQILKRSLLLGLIAIAGGAALSLLLSYIISKPVEKVMSFAKAVAGGDLSRRIDIKGGLELKSLSASINQMSSVLSDKICRLTNEVCERKKTEGKLQYRVDFEQVITLISNEFINLKLDEIDEGLNRALEKLIEYACVDRGYIFLYSADNLTMSNVYEGCREGVRPFMEELRNVRTDSLSWINEKILRKETVLVSCPDDLPEEASSLRNEMAKESIQSLICVPMVIREKVIGFIGFDAVLYKKEWEEDIVKLLQITGEIFANALDRKRTEQAMLESEQMLKTILDTIPVRVFWKDHNSVYIGCNRVFAENAGLSNPEEIVGKTDFDLAWKEFADFYIKDDASVIESGEAKINYEEPVTSAEGKKNWARTSKIPLRDISGNIIGVLGTFEDITERKQIEFALRMSEQRFRAIAKYTYDWENWFSPDGKLIWVSPAVERVTGYSVKECMKMQNFPLNLIHEDDHKDIQKKMGGALKGSSGNDVEFRLYHKDGRIVNASVSWQPLYDDKGIYQGHRSSIRDITNRKIAEFQIQESEKKYRTLVETMSEGIGFIDSNLHFNYVNDRFCEMLGYKREEIIGHNITDFICEDSKPETRRQMKMRKKGISRQYEISWKTKSGQKLFTLISPKGSYDENNKFLGSLEVVTDITGLKKGEEELENLLNDLAIKNEELESIIYITSHDLRSPLINIQGYSKELSLVCDELRKVIAAAAINQKDKQRFDYIINNEIPNSLNYISTSTTKIDKLLKALLRLSRLGRAAITKTNLDMNKLIRNVTDSSRYLIKERNVDLKIDQLPECIGDIEQINQVFTNLVSNAIKYLDPARKGQIHISGNIEGEMSVYCVKDNGIGINEDHFAKIFELFHQLEPERPESGEGLGLTIVKRILDRNNGKIWLKSKPAEGSRFYVSLPRKK